MNFQDYFKTMEIYLLQGQTTSTNLTIFHLNLQFKDEGVFFFLSFFLSIFKGSSILILLLSKHI